LAREAAIAQQEAMARQALASIGFFMDLEQHSSPKVKATFALHINEVRLEEELGRKVDASRLLWLYWNIAEESWVQVPSHLDADGYLVCETDHFSTWTVAELESTTGIPVEYLLVVAVVVIGVAGAAVIVRKRK